ncbi:MAG TPA: flagellar hook-basal body complex protein, partial [Bacillota bacterium]
MMRSLFAGVSGLRNHQIRMDVIGNNIANVNTVGFKASRTTFRQLFSQTLRGAARPTDDRAGTNPIQIGMGMTLGTITPVHTPGGTQVTGNATDVAISGNGFFILGQGQSRFYTRVGAFGIDAEGYLADPNTGLRVQGWMASGGKLPEPTPGNLEDIRIRIGDPIPAKATTSARLVGNLDANAAAPDPVSGS